MRPRCSMIIACVVLALAACRPAPDIDKAVAVANDPRTTCPGSQSVATVAVPVGDTALGGSLFYATGQGRAPTLAWFHGFPGLPEPTPELVAAVTGAGLNLLYVHYRGSWGTPGAFDAASAVEDGAAALAFLRDPGGAHACRVDPGAIVTVGDSFGSWVALQVAARDPQVRCAAGALLVDLGTLGAEASRDAAVRDAFAQMFAAVDQDPELGFQLRGGAEGLMSELQASHEANALAGRAAVLADRPILLVGAEADQLAPPGLHLQPFADALADAGARAVTTRLFQGGHELADAAYAATLVDWVQEACLTR